MDNDTTQNIVTQASPAAEIISRQDAFSVYNISRIRELIRAVSHRKYIVFQSIPFWLHLNHPRMPGYVADVRVPFGIYRFRESGFWRQGLSRLNMSEKRLRPFLPVRAHIQGLYLMGSSGTLAQTDTSDFDYWVLVDKGATPLQERLLRLKLDGIETYCRESYGQAVTFFVLDAARVRANRFDIMDEESSGSAQRTLLKEEFYRTFIMIAGRIPYWAVLPPGLDDAQYRHRIDAAIKVRHLRFAAEDYIDLGNLAALNPKECLGSLLWQIYKSRHSPVKSLIKAALVAHYFFFGESGFLCDIIKARLFEGGGEYSLADPYTLMFERGLEFFRFLEDRQGEELLKTCIFLRLRGRSTGAGSPREELLKRYVARWGWDSDQVRRLDGYGKWPEARKLEFERSIFEKISFLYDLIHKDRGRGVGAIDMTDRDLTVLTNRIAAHFRRKPGKIPRCSSFVRRHAASLRIIVDGKGGQETMLWSVFGAADLRSLDPPALLFVGPELLKAAGWVVLNGLYRGKKSPVGFQAEALCGITGKQARRLVHAVYDFSRKSLAADPGAETTPALSGLLGCLHRTGGSRSGAPLRVDFLIVNTWGEFFFESFPLSHLETEDRACYSIATYLWDIAKGNPASVPPFRLVRTGGSGTDEAQLTVETYLLQLTADAAGEKVPALENNQNRGPENSLILDK